MLGHRVSGIGAGAIWALFLLSVGARLELPIFALVPTIFSAFLAPGLVAAGIWGWVRFRRPGVSGRRVWRDTTEQLMLALCIWPAAAVMLQGDGPGVIMALGLGLALARLVAWAGAVWLPPLRDIGLMASYSPTVAVALWALWRLIASLSAA